LLDLLPVLRFLAGSRWGEPNV